MSSDRYDFDSIRVGIQPFTLDFRGFLFQDNQLGIRLFGDRDNNRFQYNLALLRAAGEGHQFGPERHHPDAAQRLCRRRQCLCARICRCPASPPELTAVYNTQPRSRTISTIDYNGFPVRPALLGDIRARATTTSVYLGYNGDGHWGGINLTVIGLWRARPGPQQHLHRPPGGHPRLFPRRRAVLWISTGSGCGCRRSMPRGDDNPYDNIEDRLRRHLRESAVRRRRHQLLDPPVDPVRRRRPRHLPQRPQRRAQRPALVEGRGPVQLQQSGHHPAGRRRGLRRAARAARRGQRQSPVVRRYHRGAGAAPGGHHLPGPRLGHCRWR